MKARARLRTLGDLCLLVGGGTPPKSNGAYYGGDIPWATVRDMQRDELEQTEFRITAAGLRASTSNMIPANNVIVATRVGLGKVCINSRAIAINQDLRGIIPKNLKEIGSRYLFWWFKNAAPLIEEEGTGATVKGVKLGFIRSLRVPVPTLLEQQRIVSILDTAFENIARVRANTDKNIANARELFDSELSAVFSGNGKGWQTSSLGQHVHFIDYRGRTPAKTATGLRLITAKNVRMGFIRNTPAEFVDPATYDSWMTRGIPRFGDVLFTTEAPLANVAQLDTEERVVFAQRIIIIQAEPSRLDSALLKYALMSGPVQRRIHEQGTGATAKGIKASLLKKIKISFPNSLREQRAFVSRLDRLQHQVDELVKQLETKLAAIEELKRSMLHAAFDGDL